MEGRIMNLKKGDKVKCMDESSSCYKKMGTVVKVHNEGKFSHMSVLFENGSLYTFSSDEKFDEIDPRTRINYGYDKEEI